MKRLLYIFNLILCLFMFTACEEETDNGTGSGDDGNTGGGTSMYSSEDFSGTVWEETMLDFGGMLTTSEDVSVLDAWNPASGDFSVMISGNGSDMIIPLTYLNVEIDTSDDYDYDETTTWWEFEISSESEWSEDNHDAYYELDIECSDGENQYNGSACNMNFESDDFNFWTSLDEGFFTWDADTYTLTINSDFTYSDEWEGKTFTIPAGASLTAGTMTFESGVPTQILDGSEMIEPWETRIWEFSDNGTIISEYSTDCSLVDAEEEWDCYDHGCDVLWSEGDGMWSWGEDFVDDNGNYMWDEGESFTDKGDDVVGCEDVDCESFTSEDECWSSQACDWDWDDEACESWGDDSGPEDFTWEIVDDQMILTPGENADEDGPQMPLALDIISMDDDNLVLEMNLEMCDFYGGYYMGMLYYMYYYFYGYDWGTGNATGYYADYFSEMLDNDDLCVYIYDDFAGDIYGLEADQVEAVHQTQTITFVTSEWPSARGSRKTKNSIISPKLFNKMFR